ncbi:MAG: cation-translocating P-type ATPase, partial [Chlamydiia bacterium]|nr:cation-translocating P-type ATPase [Chlamydiia bacterium]
SAQSGEGESCRFTLEVNDFWCPSCAEVVRLLLLQEAGVKQVAADYATDLVTVEYDPKTVGKEKLFAHILSYGYTPRSFEDAEEAIQGDRLTLRFAIAAFCALNAMMLAYPLYAGVDESYRALFAWLSFAFALPAVAVGWPVYTRFYRALQVGFLGMEALVTVAVFASFTLSTWQLLQGSHQIFFDSMSVLVALVLLGKLLERKAKQSAKLTHLELLRALPRKGRRASGEYVPLKEIAKGDLLVAYQGEKIVLDGEVVEGGAALDEALITGEAMPLYKREGDTLFAGALVQSGWVKYRVSAPLEGSSLKVMIDLIESELQGKVEKLPYVDRIARAFVPLTVLIALAAFAFQGGEEGIRRFLAVLLIACPCTLGIAIPLVEARLIHQLASLGVLVRRRRCLPLLAEVTDWVFDKTGTVTEGKFTVREISKKLTAKEASVLKALSLRSTHPVSVGVARAVADDPSSLLQFSEVPGQGLIATTEEGEWRLGSERLMSDWGLKLQSESVETTVVFAREGELIASITLGDALKEGKIPFSNWHLLSGDRFPVVADVAKKLGCIRFAAEQDPLEKKAYIEKLQEGGKVVCFVGDGINDAPALAASAVGISVKTGADMSVSCSDIQLTTERFEALLEAALLAKKADRLVRQNLFWAFAYNIIGIGLAAFGMLQPLYGAVAMVLSSLLVV